MDHDNAFLRAIIDSPDDVNLRNIYADWLEERGDLRGEFLRIIQDLALLPYNDKRRSRCVVRFDELRRLIHPVWRAVVELRLPSDLIAFLAGGNQLTYDPDECEAGAVGLLPLDRLSLELFPMFIDSGMGELYEDDPHKEENGYYLVTGVNLVGECTDYDPCGLLLWLPIERRFATWDAGHWFVCMFGPEQTWTEIVKAPAEHINAQWGDAVGDFGPAPPLRPWLIHRHSKQKGGGPFPFYEAETNG